MNLFSTLKLIIRTLMARKGRSLLTTLGIVIGVAGVIIIISLGAGAQSLVLGQVTKLGANLLSVQPGKSNEKGPPAQVFGIVVTTLTNDDANALRTGASHASAVNAEVLGTGTVTWENKSVDTNFTGSDYALPNVVDIKMAKGQFYSKEQDTGGANVAVLGATLSDELFANTGVDPIGQVVKIKSVPLRVVGVMALRGNTFGQDPDDRIYMPLSIGQEQILGIHYLTTISIKIDAADNIDSSIATIKTIMNQQHHIQTDANADYTVRNIADAVSILTTITNALSLFLVAMAAVALVVGGVGILNIMLVTVAERTREIGLRKAVGATDSAVRNQFLLEAGTLTTLGGIMGIILGVVVSYLTALLIRYLGYDWAFVISPTSVVLAVGVSVLTGVIFGSYPAFKASKLNPIEALRYE